MRFLEFLEWRADRPDPSATGPLHQAISELEAAWPGQGETWLEQTAEHHQEEAP